MQFDQGRSRKNKDRVDDDDDDEEEEEEQQQQSHTIAKF